MSFFMNSFKYGLFVVNLIFFILGIVLCYGCYNSLHNPILEPDSIDKTFIYLCLFISAIVLLISFLGCCGTCYENPVMIKCYAFLILICIVLQVCVFFMISSTDTDKLGNVLKEEYIKKYDQDKKEIKEFIDALQSSNKCCGIENYHDYDKDVTKLPRSCCPSNDDVNCTEDTVYKIGCKLTIQEYFEASKKPFYTVLGFTLGIQLLIVVISCALSKNLRERFEASY